MAHEKEKLVRKGLFTNGYEVYDERRYDYYSRRKLTPLGKISLILAGLAAAYASFAENTLDLLGDRSKTISTEQIKENAAEQYRHLYDGASPAGKFVLQYGATATVSTYGSEGGKGLWGAFFFNDANDKDVVINNGCLQNTAYDINGGEIRAEFRGLFSSAAIEVGVPSAAAFAVVDEERADLLTVRSGHADSVDLHFKGLKTEKELVPADSATQNILDTYGCEIGVQAVVTHPLRELASEYITLD